MEACTPMVYARDSFSNSFILYVYTCLLAVYVNLTKLSALSITTEEVDFVLATEEVVFLPNVTRLCGNVTLLDDSVVESTETFFVSLVTNDPFLLLSDPAVISIVDKQDRAFFQFVCYKVLYIPFFFKTQE